MLKGKKVIALGERDGIAGPAIEAIAKAAGADVVFKATECFVWTASGAMDLESQEAISRLAEEHDPSELLVLIGAPDPEAAEITAETVRLGDPAYAGALAGVQLGLDVYHVLEEPVREDVPEDVWEEQIGVQSDVLEAEELAQVVAKMREQKPDSDGQADSDGKAEARADTDAEAKSDSDDSDDSGDSGDSGSEDGDSN